MKWIEFSNLEHWSSDDRFCVVPLPEGWVAVDHGKSPLEFSDPYETIEEAKKWAEERISTPQEA